MKINKTFTGAMTNAGRPANNDRNGGTMKKLPLATILLASTICSPAFALTPEEAKTAYQGLNCEMTAFEGDRPTCAKCNDLTDLIVHYDPSWDAIEPVPVPVPVPTPTPIPEPISPIWEQDANGLLSIPATGFSTNTGWTEIGGWMQALPDAGVNLTDLSGPALTYKVKFTRSGLSYLWVHGFKVDASGDSIYIAIDGVRISSVSFYAKEWSNVSQESAVISFQATAGEHTISAHQREDGTKFSEIRVSSDANYHP